MSHQLTQPEEIDQVWLAHQMEDDAPQSYGCDESFEATGGKCSHQSYVGTKLDSTEN